MKTNTDGEFLQTLEAIGNPADAARFFRIIQDWDFGRFRKFDESNCSKDDGSPSGKHTFTPAMASALINESLDSRNLPELLQNYINWYPTCPGAPAPSDLKPDEARAVIERETFSAELDTNWTGYVARKKAVSEQERDSQNPFLPRWFTKAEGKPNVWVGDTGPVSNLGKVKLKILYKCCTPELTRDIKELLDIPVTKEIELLGSILESMVRYQPYFVTPMGDKEPEFQWSRTLTILGGLGMQALRVLAQDVAESTEEADWQYFATCTDDELKNEVLDAQSICGYPLGFARADFIDVDRILRNENQLTEVPSWYKQLLLLHILKYTRFHSNYKGKPHICAAYRGALAMIEVPEEAIFLPISSPTNQTVIRELCRVLQIDRGTGKRNKSIFDIVCSSLCDFIVPQWLPNPVDLRSRPEIITPPSIQVAMAFERKTDKNWIDSGIKICNVATIDLNTGAVNKDAYISGEMVGALNWPMSLCSGGALKNWRSKLPTKVEPVLPSEMLSRYIHNVNDLGMTKAQKAILDSVMLLDLMRDDLYGSRVGMLMVNEYPLICIQPSGHSVDDTTNQGKTNTARILAGALVPGIQVTQISRSASAPAQRAAASPLEQWGTALYDEFVPLNSHEHFLSQAGLQSLATGGGVTPGRALENANPIFLRHPLFFTLKLNKFPPDVYNRQVKILLDALTDENSATDEELDIIMSGEAAMIMRLSALLWIKKNNFVEVIKNAKLVGGKWRFDAHMTVATHLGATVEEIDEYMKKSQSFTDVQVEEGNELAEDLGMDTLVNIQRMFDDCQPDFLDQLRIASESNEGGEIKPYDFLKTIIENGTKRQIDHYLNNVRSNEDRVIRQLNRMLRRGDLIRNGYRLRLVLNSDKCPGPAKVLNGSRHRRNYLVLIRDADFISPGIYGIVQEAQKEAKKRKKDEAEKLKKLNGLL
ncbi:MAG TPA: hypothetical protein VGP72_12275 [Planctomycetota bacterium]|jgi:hypothetical protein